MIPFATRAQRAKLVRKNNGGFGFGFKLLKSKSFSVFFNESCSIEKKSTINIRGCQFSLVANMY